MDFYTQGDTRIDDALLAWFGSIYARSADIGLLRPGLDIPFATRAIYAMIDYVVAGFDVHTPAGELTRAADQVARLQWHALYVGEPDAAPPYAQLGLPGAARKNRDVPRRGGASASSSQR